MVQRDKFLVATGRRTEGYESRWITQTRRVVARVGGLLIGVIICITAMPVRTCLAQSQPDCFDGPNVKVTISGRLFAVPIRYRPFISMPGGKSISPVSKVTNSMCQEEFVTHSAEPIEADGLFIVGLRDVQARDTHLQSLHRVSFELHRSSLNQSLDLREIAKFKDRVKRSGGRLEDLPQFAGLYAFARVEEKPLYKSPFMTVPGGIDTPGGYPIVVDCYGKVVAPSQFPDPSGPDASCKVEYEWSRGIALLYRFSEGAIPIDHWAELDAAVRGFVRRLVIAPQQ
jgi:hypothetical protein